MKTLLIIFATLFMAACSTTKTPEISESGKTKISTPDKPNPVSTANTSKPMSTDVAASQLAAEKLKAEKLAAEKLAQEIKELQNLSVYFDFDKFIILPDYNNVLKMQAAFIMAHKNDVVTVEGNADERGSDEYNLALGDKRANSAQKALEILGVPRSQIKTKSLGEEKPRLTCHEEKCWKENRRDDFIHSF